MKQIYNCPQLFANQCPKSWNELQATEEERRRYCSTCESSVYECRTPNDFVSLGLKGRCVALPDHVFDRLCGQEPDGLFLPMGLPSKVGLERMRDDLELKEAWMNAIEQFNREDT